MNSFFKWLVLSSEDPKQVALTIRGIIVLSIPTIIALLGDAGIKVMEGDVMHVVVIGTSILGSVLAVIGLIRKLVNHFSAEKVVVFKAKKKK